MASQSFENSTVRIESESQSQGSEVVSVLRRGIVVLMNIVLALSRVLFSVVLLNSVINWNDLQWTVLHGFALLPLCWAIVAVLLTVAGQFRWKLGGRIMTVLDMLVSATVIVVFPVYTLSALALAILSLTFLVLRHDGRFASLLPILPLAAMLVRPLGGLDLLGASLPVSYVSIGVAGEIVAFVLSSLAALFSILIIIHIRMVERPLTFQQPWEEEFAVGVGKHNIAPVMDCIQRIYPGGKLVCILNSPTRGEGDAIISNSAISPADITPLRSQLTGYADHGRQPAIVALANGFEVDIGSGQQSPVPESFGKMARGLKGLGFVDGILFDFKLGGIRGRLFFSTDTPVDEALRNDMITLQQQLDRFFDNASKWDKRRQEMMGLARDLARRDLHDGILQSLAALKMRLVTIMAGPHFSSNPEVESLRKTVDIITVEQTRLRALLHNDEEDDDAINLVEAMEVCLKTLSLQWEISVTLASQEPALPVDRESAENIEYLVREAIANAIRHAGAKQLIFTMALNKGDLMMTLKDDLGASGVKTNSRHAARTILASRSLSQRLAMVNGHAYSEGLEDSTLLSISIPLDFTENE